MDTNTFFSFLRRTCIRSDQIRSVAQSCPTLCNPKRLAVHTLVVAAREVAAAGALDLDHARAQVGELARGKGRGDGVFEGDDGDAVEGAGHEGLPCNIKTGRAVSPSPPWGRGQG